MIESHEPDARAPVPGTVHACGFDLIPSDLGVVPIACAGAARGGGSRRHGARSPHGREGWCCDPARIQCRILVDPYAPLPAGVAGGGGGAGLPAPRAQRARASMPNGAADRTVRDERGQRAGELRSHALLGQPWVAASPTTRCPRDPEYAAGCARPAWPRPCSFTAADARCRRRARCSSASLCRRPAKGRRRGRASVGDSTCASSARPRTAGISRHASPAIAIRLRLDRPDAGAGGDDAGRAGIALRGAAARGHPRACSANGLIARSKARRPRVRSSNADSAPRRLVADGQPRRQRVRTICRLELEAARAHRPAAFCSQCDSGLSCAAA